MRLLNVHNFEFRPFHGEVPKYVIASHRWDLDSEITIKDIIKQQNKHKAGYRKVEAFAKYVRENVSHVEWVWIDTCCVDQRNGPEVSRAVNSMFRWYASAELCLAYLADVKNAREQQELRQSDWFCRGWTLQELLAPPVVVFLTRSWEVIGHKGGGGYTRNGVQITAGPPLEATIATITGIPDSVLHIFSLSKSISVEERLAWIAGRRTTYEEDKSYSLLGMFGVTMPLNYGEGAEKARSRLLEEIDKAKPPAPSHNLPFPRDPDFVDRGTLVARMGEKLARPAGRAALVGLGGVGKSQLAIEFAYRLRKRSPVTWVLWVHASNVERFKQSVRDIADLMEIAGHKDEKADVFQLLRGWLRDADHGSWTVILDNADDIDFLTDAANVRGMTSTYSTLFDCFPVCDHGSILVTSRSVKAAQKVIEYRDIMKIGPMTGSESLNLLQAKLCDRGDAADLPQLATALEFMPLALAQAAAYIRNTGGWLTVQQYLEKLQTNDKSMMELLAHDDNKDLRRDRDAHGSIILTWQISFEHIRQIRPSAAGLLALMSFCDRNSIPESLLRAKGSNDRTQPQTEASENQGATSASSTSTAALGDIFEKDIFILQHYSFIAANSSSTFEMHRLVQLATQRWLSVHGVYEHWSERFVTKLYTAFPDYRRNSRECQRENREQCQLLFPHVKSAFKSKPSSRILLDEWVTTMGRAAGYLVDQKDAVSLRQAEEILINLVETQKQLFGEYDPETLVTMSNLASTYQYQGRWTEAEVLNTEILESSTRLLGEEHPNTLATLGDLALTCRSQGHLTEAEILDTKAIEILTQVLGEEHPDTLARTSNLATTYRRQGRYIEAETIGVKSLELSKRELGEEHPDTLFRASNLATTYAKQGRYTDAEILGTKVIEMSKRVLGEEHPDTLIRASNLAATYAKQGRYTEAENIGVKALEISKRVLGEEHPSTLRHMASRAAILYDQGRGESAYPMLEMCVDIATRQFGTDHPRTTDWTQTFNRWKGERSNESWNGEPN